MLSPPKTSHWGSIFASFKTWGFLVVIHDSIRGCVRRSVRRSVRPSVTLLHFGPLGATYGRVSGLVIIFVIFIKSFFFLSEIYCWSIVLNKIFLCFFILFFFIHYINYFINFIIFFVRDGIHSVADYNSTRVGVVVVVAVVVVVVALFHNGITWERFELSSWNFT